ncbi:MAG: hypothetical protein ACJ736_02235 [Streptomyces sp.]
MSHWLPPRVDAQVRPRTRSTTADAACSRTAKSAKRRTAEPSTAYRRGAPPAPSLLRTASATILATSPRVGRLCSWVS